MENIAELKSRVVNEIMEVNDAYLLADIIEILHTSNLKTSFKQLTINELNARIDKSEENFRNGQFKSVDSLIEKYNR
jgi:hypothetical protein